MAYEIWTPEDLYQVLSDDRMDPIPSYFLDTYFTEEHYSGDGEILIAELPAVGRWMAPFVLPTEQGKPIFKQKGETAKTLTPPYLKPKDVVRPTEQRNRRPSDLRTGIKDLQEKYDSRVIEIMNFHRRAIKMQEAWMAARAFIDGKVTVKYDRDQGTAFPEVTIDFGRDAGHTVVLVGSYWSDPDYNIIGDLNIWSDRMYNAKNGGRPAVMIVGSAVAPFIQKNKGILALLSTQVRGNEGTTMQTGLMNIDRPMSYIATVGGVGQSIEIWTYKDTVDNDDGTQVDIFDPKEVLLVAPGARGVKAYGAIYDVDALETGEALSTDIFAKMFKTDDPGELFIMNQSSPLPIPLYPNRTLKAKVLA